MTESQCQWDFPLVILSLVRLQFIHRSIFHALLLNKGFSAKRPKMYQVQLLYHENIALLGIEISSNSGDS